MPNPVDGTTETRQTKERRLALREVLRRTTLTVHDAWTWGHAEGFYVGGDAPLVKADLNAVGRRHDGFWRARTRLKRVRALRWGDYWTAR